MVFWVTINAKNLRKNRISPSYGGSMLRRGLQLPSPPLAPSLVKHKCKKPPTENGFPQRSIIFKVGREDITLMHTIQRSRVDMSEKEGFHSHSFVSRSIVVKLNIASLSI